MTRDWWWPWWVSTAFDLAVAAVALVVLLRSSRRLVRVGAAGLIAVALIAAVAAPLVMKEPARDPTMEKPDLAPPDPTVGHA